MPVRVSFGADQQIASGNRQHEGFVECPRGRRAVAAEECDLAERLAVANDGERKLTAIDGVDADLDLPSPDQVENVARLAFHEKDIAAVQGFMDSDFLDRVLQLLGRRG